ncbi:hypothetical protein R3P38DRAFT_2935028 [Favolaschia claudopus]|uniref:Uncharacterized protein n=1 Tax=Favolaschia claudopus TaxID=2862362 RepID=A0AAW0BNG2_9AGAR
MKWLGIPLLLSECDPKRKTCLVEPVRLEVSSTACAMVVVGSLWQFLNETRTLKPKTSVRKFCCFRQRFDRPLSIGPFASLPGARPHTPSRQSVGRKNDFIRFRRAVSHPTPRHFCPLLHNEPPTPSTMLKFKTLPHYRCSIQARNPKSAIYIPLDSFHGRALYKIRTCLRPPFPTGRHYRPLDFQSLYHRERIVLVTVCSDIIPPIIRASLSANIEFSELYTYSYLPGPYQTYLSSSAY